MGEIFIEGLGTVEIAGDTPTEEEAAAIASGLGDPDARPDPMAQVAPTPQPQVPEGVELERTRTGKEPALEGPLGLMPVEARARTRNVIEGQPGLVQFAAEITPSAIGATVGGALGVPFGPLGITGGAMIGGALGEFIAQELGIAPSSELNMALAAGGPAAGQAVGQTLRLSRRMMGLAISNAPFAKSALSRIVMGRSLSRFENIGTHILAKQKGLMRRGTSDLYRAAFKAGVKVDPDTLNATKKAIQDLSNELAPLASASEVQAARGILKQTTDMLLSNPDGITIENLVQARSFVGTAIDMASSKIRGGKKTLRTAKQVFAKMSEDLDRIAASPFKKGRQARLAKAAVARAKLGFAVDSLEKQVANFSKTNPETGQTVINFKGLQNWINDVTNPKHAKYNKNFVDALKDELPDLKKTIRELAKIGSAGSPGGPGALVLRGQGAKAGRYVGGALGAAVGGSVGGPIGAAFGAVTGAQLPEIMVALMTTKTGSQMLLRMANLGKGEISSRAWTGAFAVAMRALGETKENIPMSITPEEAKRRSAAAAEDTGEPDPLAALPAAAEETEDPLAELPNATRRRETRRQRGASPGRQGALPVIQ